MCLRPIISTHRQHPTASYRAHQYGFQTRYEPASRMRVGQWKPAPKPEAQLRAEEQVFTDPTKLSWQVYHSLLNLWKVFPGLVSQQCLEDFADLWRSSWLALQIAWKTSLTCEDFPDLTLKNGWKILLSCDVCQIYQWNMLLRWQLAQVSEILQTYWRPGQDKTFIVVQTRVEVREGPKDWVKNDNSM